MNTTLFAWLRFALVAACFVMIAPHSAAQTQAGAIKAVRVTGEVNRIDSSGAQTTIVEGQALIESDSVVTGKGSGVVLVFMNGSSVKLAAESRLAIEEFKIDPLGRDLAVAALKEEPTVSKTRLNLAYGDLVGNVKKLKTASRFAINTPVGAAGIRGTTFRLVLRVDSNGRIAFTLSTAEGRVVFTGATPAAADNTAPTEATEVEVSAGTEVSASVEIDPTSNQVTGLTISPTAAISEQASSAIASAITTAINQALENTTFTTTEQSQAAEQTQPETPAAAGAQSLPTTTASPSGNEPQVLDTTTRSGSG